MDLRAASFVIVDLETTGFSPGLDRIVEVCIYRIEPQDSCARRVFDSVINPHRRMGADDVHGISMDEARKAPSFEQVARRLLEALSGAVVVAHNASFDMSFLVAELGNLDVDFDPPYLCTQALAAMLGVCPSGASLEQLCRALYIPLFETVHMARADAQATALAFMMLRQQLFARGVHSVEGVRALAEGHSARSMESLSNPSISLDDFPDLLEGTRPLMPRALTPAQRRVLEQEAVYLSSHERAGEVTVRQEEYAKALMDAVSSFQISQQQFQRLLAMRNTSGMTVGQIRAVHAKVFAAMLSGFLTDSVLDEEERQRLVLLNECLSQLGWAPGQ